MSATSDYRIENESEVFLINPDVLKTWRNHRQVDEINHEGFGVLIGSQALVSKEIWIEHCTTPKGRDKSTRTSFELIDPFHQKMVDHFYRVSNMHSGYLGTWHTHPEKNQEPSSLDIQDWMKCIKRNPDRNLLFVIVGVSYFCVYRLKKTIFERAIMEKI
jgi:integrative and conjugative element protein (TIGR02256 family)